MGAVMGVVQVDTYLKPLRLALQANVSSVMCAYDAINNVPCCGNAWLLAQVRMP
jgi:beta-glucosidase-like glycosyl hydrolase